MAAAAEAMLLARSLGLDLELVQQDRWTARSRRQRSGGSAGR